MKLEHILLDVNKNIKIADFGFSTSAQNGKQTLTSRCGSPMYAAPEVLSADPQVGPEVNELIFLTYLEKVDIWALGVILFAMVTGEFPWRGSDIQAQLRHAAKGVYVTPEFLSTGNVLTI